MATTGFHRQQYYPPGYWLWSATAEQAAAYFIEELTVGTRETKGTSRAATIKIGYEGQIDGQTRALMEGVAQAARETGALVLFHTEQGKNVEALIPFFSERGVMPTRLYMCHVDKRLDFGLHRELAQAGVLLGYDTFIRPKYDPENGVWKLLPQMVESDLADHVAIGLDMAYSSMWRHYGGAPGLLALPEQIAARLHAESFPEAAIRNMLGKNIARYLVRQPPN
jgi:5-phospho-D-xylono-1,4-lactonase